MTPTRPKYSERRAYTTRAPTHDADDVLDGPTALDPLRVTDDIIASWPEPPPLAPDEPTSGDELPSGEACAAPPPPARGGALRLIAIGLALVGASLLAWIVLRGWV